MLPFLSGCQKDFIALYICELETNFRKKANENCSNPCDDIFVLSSARQCFFFSVLSFQFLPCQKDHPQKRKKKKKEIENSWCHNAILSGQFPQILITKNIHYQNLFQMLSTLCQISNITHTMTDFGLHSQTNHKNFFSDCLFVSNSICIKRYRYF